MFPSASQVGALDSKCFALCAFSVVPVPSIVPLPVEVSGIVSSPLFEILPLFSNLALGATSNAASGSIFTFPCSGIMSFPSPFIVTFPWMSKAPVIYKVEPSAISKVIFLLLSIVMLPNSKFSSTSTVS